MKGNYKGIEKNLLSGVDMKPFCSTGRGEDGRVSLRGGVRIENPRSVPSLERDLSRYLCLTLACASWVVATLERAGPLSPPRSPFINPPEQGKRFSMLDGVSMNELGAGAKKRKKSEFLVC